jgi:hypothetical protein
MTASVGWKTALGIRVFVTLFHLRVVWGDQSIYAKTVESWLFLLECGESWQKRRLLSVD